MRYGGQWGLLLGAFVGLQQPPLGQRDLSSVLILPAEASATQSEAFKRINKSDFRGQAPDWDHPVRPEWIAPLWETVATTRTDPLVQSRPQQQEVADPEEDAEASAARAEARSQAKLQQQQQRSICHPGRKVTFYLHGVQRWRCVY